MNGASGIARLPILDREPPTKGAVQADDSAKPLLSLWLSLMLVLLSFFIALLAGVQPKRQAAEVPAVVETEASAVVDLRDSPAVIADDVARGEAVRLISSLASSLAGLGPVALETAVATSALAATLSLPTTAFFEPLATTLRADRLVVLDRIVTAASDLPVGFQLVFGATLTVGTANGTPNVATADDTLAADRAAVLASTLVARGLPPEAIAAGIAGGPSGEMVLTIRAQPLLRRAETAPARRAALRANHSPVVAAR